MGWLKLTTSETGCCRVDLPCSMVPNRVEAGRCRTNLRQETTNRPAQALDQTLLSSRACIHCFGGALESSDDRGRALKRDLALSTGPWLSINNCLGFPSTPIASVSAGQGLVASTLQPLIDWGPRRLPPTPTPGPDQIRKGGLHRALLAAAAPPRGRSSTIG